MKLVHTADIHMDTSFADVDMPSSFGNRRRQSLRDVFHTIVERAGDWPADALLIAGDLFEHTRVSRDTLSFIAAEFQAIHHVPVFIAPGNHDPYQSDSPYATENWPDNVHIFTEPAWRCHSVLEGRLAVHGFAFDGPDISRNPFGSLRIDNDDDVVHVAVAHGSERGHQPSEKPAYAPFDAAEASVARLRYLALGHFHSFTKIDGESETVICYSGAPEGHGFGETGVRHYAEVEIADGNVKVVPVESSKLVYVTHSIACDEFSSSQGLIDAIRERTRAERRLQAVRVTLIGACLPDISNRLGAVHDVLAPELDCLVLIDNTEPVEDYEDIARDDTSLAAFVRTLHQEISDSEHDAARRELLERARELGVAAFRGRELEIHGLEQR